MGAWGTALYSNDISCDVRDMCNEVYPLVGKEAGQRLVLEEFAEIIEGDIDNEYSNFWFALADWQWKHGVLTDEVKERTIYLIKSRAGIEEWEESGNKSDVKKRIAVMDKLFEEIKSLQPTERISKPKIKKPKHKPGDIIIFRTCTKEYEYADTVWNIDHCSCNFYYSPEIANRIPERISPPYEAYDKYIAILCVGTEKLPYSHYVEGFYNEYSVYAFYDYVSDKKPTVEDLRKCGFLPNIKLNSEEPKGAYCWAKTISVEWVYKFIVFYLNKENNIQSMEKVHCPSESERFNYLFSRKNYFEDTASPMEMFGAFASFFEEKVRLSSIGEQYDNLLDENIVNPKLSSGEMYDRNLKLLVKNNRE
ncbi:MAG: hypothetical protein IJX27_02230 [Clostridia bacterium]|nr:hypothetical protein [Clostridia bacterium]